MPLGSKAKDPNTRYVVYEFVFNGRVYYTGIGPADSKRATDRWNYVGKQLERLKREGALPLGKLRDLEKTSGAVIRALIERGEGPHEIRYPWVGVGRREALIQEAKRMDFLLNEGCVLANVVGNPKPATVGEVLRYLQAE